MVKYKDKAIIYGGVSSDDLNEVTIINSKTLSINQGTRAPFRRREHAAAAFG